MRVMMVKMFDRGVEVPRRMLKTRPLSSIGACW